MAGNPPDLSAGSVFLVVQQFAAQLRGYAKETGTACDMIGCDALTLGVRCEGCMKRICMTHAYWKLSLPRVLPYCVLCCVAQNNDLFSDADDEE